MISKARLHYLGLCMAPTSFNMFLRAVRWRVLLSSRGTISLATAFWATSAGYFGNNFLPARAGELVRSYMISSRTGLTKTYVLTTALAERMMDAITLVVISALVMLTLPERPGWFEDAARPFAIAGLLGVAAIAIAPHLEATGKTILSKIPLPRRIAARLVRTLEQGLLGLRAFHDVRRALNFATFTLLIWVIDAVGTVVGAASLGLNISLPLAFLLIAGLGFGSALPSTPGYVGIYQFVAVSVLVPFGLSRTDAIAYILLVQALQYVVITFWGFMGFWQYRKMRATEGAVENGGHQ